ncbi:MAG: phosphatidate cytidylyltransferase [Polyangia bacterium]
MKPANHNLLARVATAVVGLPVVGLFIFWRDPRGFLALCLLASVLALVEYTGLTLPGRPLGERVGIILIGAGLFLGIALRPALAVAWLLTVVLATGLVLLPGADDPSCAWRRMSAAGFGACYVGGLLAALPLLHRGAGPAWVALAIAVTFANDTGAYLAGRAWGRRKLAPAISPGKTVEGALGGLVANLIVTFAARALFMPGLTVPDCLWVGIPAAIVGPAGDLVESLLKRGAGAKDSGRLLPGHGGILDRIDALLFTGAYVFLYATHLR